VAIRAGHLFDGKSNTLLTTPAKLMGWENRIGSVEQGKFDDIVVFSGDPLSAATEPERLKFVRKGGQVIKNDFHWPFLGA